MSYKHNNLMAMRQNYWDDCSSQQVQIEKQFFKQTLDEKGIFQSSTIEDAKYFFFSLPSIIIVKGYSLGFLDHTVQSMIMQFIQNNKERLMNRAIVKIQYQIS